MAGKEAELANLARQTDGQSILKIRNGDQCRKTKLMAIKQRQHHPSRHFGMEWTGKPFAETQALIHNGSRWKRLVHSLSGRRPDDSTAS